ncbi:MAG: TetR/AcrR family transcriptional regulator [Rhodobacteraceae bacterium]|jgi:AcrR family transcriptional regulator|nr:TetR/AcrR family transcriptional regulator [Paracoccaceae bacterium]
MITHVYRISEEKRPYRLNARAKAQDETRRRIVEATMQLHEEIGPRATTISAIADRAGVQRLTVYRHFPDGTAVFQACTAHWLSLNPPPDPADWAGIADPRDRLRAALAAFYGYYAGTHRMWRVSFRDVDHVPALQGPMSEVAAFMASVADGVLDAFGEIGANQLVRATVRHALHFPTWSDLDDRGLSDAAKVDLAMAWLDGVLRGRGPLQDPERLLP